MTAQRAEIFINSHPNFDVGDIKLFEIIGYEIKAEIEKQEKAFTTSLWRGFIGTYELNPSGTLYLVKVSVFTGQRNKEFKDTDVSEKIEGNFVLDFRERFFGDRLFVPFENGKVILDQSKWYKEKGFRGDSGLIDELFPNISTKS